MSGVIPQFEAIQDPLAAEAFSEFYFRGGDFKIASDAALVASEGFPPEPAWQTAICSAYLGDPDCQGNQPVRRKFVMTPEVANRSAEDVAATFIDGYRDQVGPLHDIADTLQETEGSSFFNVGNLALRAVELASEARLRTIASFVVFSAANSNQHYTGLLIPRRTFDRIPLEDRQQWMNLVQSFESAGGLSLAEDAPDVHETVKRIFQNDPKHKNFAFFAAALSLPKVEQVQSAIEQYIAQQPADKYAGMSRQERREAQVRERREARKNKN